jgi:hypothetical protein
MTQNVGTPAHVIFTRFNLPSKGYESYVRSTEHWLQKRVELFERFCLPSVMADFRWIVYFDPQSPPWLMRRIDGWRRYDRFQALFREEVSLAEKQSDIAAFLQPRQRLVSTNLDNDDGLAHDFVVRIKAVRPTAPRCAIFLANGLVLNGRRTFLNHDQQNAFCSVSESWDAPITCWAYPHTELSRYMPYVSVGGDPAWLQVIHGNNVSNRVRGRRVPASMFATNFTALGAATDPDLREQLVDLLLAAPARTAREATRFVAKHILLRTLGPKGIELAKTIWRP